MTYEPDAVDLTLSRCLPCERGEHEACELLQREGDKLADCRCLHSERQFHAIARAQRGVELLKIGNLAAAVQALRAASIIADDGIARSVSDARFSSEARDFYSQVQGRRPRLVLVPNLDAQIESQFLNHTANRPAGWRKP